MACQSRSLLWGPMRRGTRTTHGAHAPYSTAFTPSWVWLGYVSPISVVMGVRQRAVPCGVLEAGPWNVGACGTFCLLGFISVDVGSDGTGLASLGCHRYPISI